MKSYVSFAELFEQWPSMAALGEDIGIDANHAQTLKSRDSLPVTYWSDIERGAKKRGIEGVDVNVLLRLAAAKKAKHRNVKKKLNGRPVVNHSRKHGQEGSSTNSGKVL